MPKPKETNRMESQDGTRTTDNGGLRRQLTLLWTAIAVLGLALSATVAWILATDTAMPDVLSTERLEIVEPDGSLSMVLANSQRPAVATIDGKVLMEGQDEERRGTPTIVFFDGRGDEVGGMMFGVRETAGGYSAIRHLSLDAYNQDQTVVLMHYQSPEGSTSGLRIVDRPDVSILDALAQLGLSAGASREQLQAAIQALPEEGGMLGCRGCPAPTGHSSDRLPVEKPRSHYGMVRDARASSSKLPVTVNRRFVFWTRRERFFSVCRNPEEIAPTRPPRRPKGQPVPPASRHACATRKHTTNPIASGSSADSVVHRPLPVSL